MFGSKVVKISLLCSSFDMSLSIDTCSVPTLWCLLTHAFSIIIEECVYNVLHEQSVILYLDIVVRNSSEYTAQIPCFLNYQTFVSEFWVGRHWATPGDRLGIALKRWLVASWVNWGRAVKTKLEHFITDQNGCRLSIRGWTLDRGRTSPGVWWEGDTI